MSSFLCEWEQTPGSLPLPRGDFPGAAHSWDVPSSPQEPQDKRTAKTTVTAVQLHTGQLVHPASSRRCKAGVACAGLPEATVVPGEAGIVPVCRDGLWQPPLPLRLQPSLCAATNRPFRAREKIPWSQVILIASVDSGSPEASRGGQPTSKHFLVPSFRLACALVSKIT